MARRAAIWADSGPGVGLGHVARCCAVASELGRLGVDVTILTCGSEGERAARDAGVTTAVADGVAAILGRGARLAIVDSYRAAAADVEALRTAGLFVAAFDDTADRVLPADLVINGAPGADPAHYDRRPGCRYLVGAAYFPLRAGFRAAAARTIREGVASVLVTMGGEDVHGWLGRAMAIAAEIYDRARIIGVLGSAAGAAPAGVPGRGEVRQAPADYPGLVREADVIVCGGGQSLVEAAAAGTPAAALLLGDDQRPQRAAVIAAGAALDAGDWRRPDGWEAQIRDALRRMRPPDVRAGLSARGRALVDGAGAERIAAAMLAAWPQA